MNVNQLSAGAEARPADPVTPVAAQNVTVRQGVTPDGIPYTVEVSGDDPTATQRTLSSVDSIAQTVVVPPPTPVTIDRSEVLRNIPRRDTPARAHYRELKQLVWGRLRNDLREREHLQRNLKTMLRLRSLGAVGCRYVLDALDRNSLDLQFRYALMTYLRSGHVDNWSDEDIEERFHCVYHRDSTFRRQFWEFWNLKHNSAEGEDDQDDEDTAGVVAIDTERVVNPFEGDPESEIHLVNTPDTPSTLPVEETHASDTLPVVTPAPSDDSGAPLRCDACGAPVSPISRCCARCGMRY